MNGAASLTLDPVLLSVLVPLLCVFGALMFLAILVWRCAR